MIHKIILLLSILILSVTSLNCDTNEIYLKSQHFNGVTIEEYWKIYSIVDNVITIVYNGTLAEVGNNKTEEFCIPKTTSMKYILEYSIKTDATGSAANSLILYNQYNNILIRALTYYKRQGNYTLDLSQPLYTGSNVHFISSSVSDTWYTSSFDDSNWSTIKSGDIISQPLSTIHYYRYSFNIEDAASLAGIIIGIQYTGTINVYLNNQLKWNYNSYYDQETENTDFYQLMLSAYGLLNTNNLLAISIEPSASAPVSHYIDVYITPLIKVIENNSNGCTNILYDVSAYSSHSYEQYPYTNTIRNLFDGIVTTAWKGNMADEALDIHYSLPPKVFAQVNMYGFGPSMTSGSSPSDFTFSGVNTYSNTTVLLSKQSGYHISYLEISNIQNSNNINLYNTFFFNVEQTQDKSQFQIYELYSYICNVEPHPFIYPSATYDYVQYVPIDTLAPSFSDYYSISVLPELPEGLTLDTKTGSITGMPTALSSAKTYVITAKEPYVVSFSITISVSSCSGVHLKIRRAYDDDSGTKYSGYNITNMDTNTIVHSEPIGKYMTSSDTYYEICVPEGRYRLEFNKGTTSSTSWSQNSYVAIYYKHIDQYEELKNYKNSTLLYKGRYDYENVNYADFMVSFFIKRGEEWKYSKGHIIEDWYLSRFDDSKWDIGTENKFGEMKHVELYRKTFTIDSLPTYESGFTLEIRFIYGILVYINEKEIYRFKIPDIINDNTNATGYYSDADYRIVRLPVNTFKQGTNLISVLLLATEKVPQTMNSYIYGIPDSTFDLSLHVDGDGYHRIFREARVTSKASGASSAHDDSLGTCANIKNNEENGIEFLDLNYEAFALSYYVFYVYLSSSYDSYPTSWILQGRDYNIYTSSTEPWTTLDTQTDVLWTTTDSTIKRRFYLQNNNKIFNQYRFVNITNKYKDMSYICEIEFYSNYPRLDYPELAYSSDHYYITRNQLAPLYMPLNPGYYTDFQITPQLPNGLTLDTKTGILYGRTLDSIIKTNYVISAFDYMRHTHQTPLIIVLSRCEDTLTNSTLEVDIHYLYEYKTTSMYIYKGTDTTSKDYIFEYKIPDLYTQITLFHAPNEIVERPFTYCLERGIYTIKFIYSEAGISRWRYPSGYIIKQEDSNIITSSLFNSNDRESIITVDLSAPIQRDVTQYRYTHETPETDAWLSEEFDASSWLVVNSGNLQSNYNHNYMRAVFDLPETSTHSSIRLSIMYTHTISLYINENLYLEETSPSQDIYIHNITIPIQTNYLHKKRNVLAIKISHHEPYESNYYLNINMDYIYGHCQSLQPYFTYIRQPTTVMNTTISSLFDNNVYTQTYIEDRGTNEIELAITNPHLNRFNNIILKTYNSTAFIMSIYGREKPEFQWIDISINNVINITSDNSITLSTPLGVTGYIYLLIVIEKIPSSISKISNNNNYIILPVIHFSFCKYDDSICAEVPPFPAVSEDDNSYAFCGEGYQGYMYRYCDGMKMRSINTQHCVVLKPQSLMYNITSTVFYSFTDTIYYVPETSFVIDTYTIDKNLPKGVVLDSKTGIISGIPYESIEHTNYTITATNAAGSISVTIEFEVKTGSCPTSGEFESVEYNQIRRISCKYGYSGSRSRMCLGTTSLYWSDVEEDCQSIAMYSIIIIAIVAIILSIAFILIKKRSYQKKVEELNKLKKKYGGVVNDASVYVYDTTPNVHKKHIEKVSLLDD